MDIYIKQVEFAKYLVDELDNKYEIYVHSSIYERCISEVAILYLNNVSSKYIKFLSEIFSKKKVLFIVNQSISCYLFSLLEYPNFYFLLESEVSNNIFIAIDAINSGGIYVSKYFRKILALKYKNPTLTNRELHVLELLVNGYTYKDIEKITYLTVGTIRNYVSNLLINFDFQNKTELALYFHSFLYYKEEK